MNKRMADWVVVTLALVSGMLAGTAQAANLTWDANGTTAPSPNDGTGTWLVADRWWDGATNATWNNGAPDNATIGSGGVGVNATITLGTVTAGSVTFTNFTGTYTLSGGSLTNSGGITIAADAGTVSIPNTTIGGAGGITMNGIYLTLNGTVNNMTGDFVVNNGRVLNPGGNGSLGTGNLTLNNGVLMGYWGGIFTRSLGAGPGEVQIFGNSGFAAQGTTGTSYDIGGTNTLVWGSTHFNPSIFVLQDPFCNANTTVTLADGINLNGDDRTISVNKDTGSANLAGVISNGSDTAGLIKNGPGNLILGNSGNSYNGPTTVTSGTLSAAVTGSLGNGGAANTLVFNGGTLRATGVITSPATRGVTMTSTGIIDNNGQSISIAGDIGGAGGLTKNGTGTLTLSGSNSYSGVTTVNAGTLAIAKQASLYNGNTANWTAANINVKSGATLAINVDTAGTAGFDGSALGTLLGSISVANNAAEGLQAGASIVLDTSTASGGTFAPSAAIANSTGAFGGVITLTKIGAGTLVFNQANTYAGQTTISGGVLQYDNGAAIPKIPLLNNGALVVNRSDTRTQGTTFHSLMGGTGSLTNTGSGTLVLNNVNTYTGTTKASAGTIVLSHALAIRNSAIDTTGAGTFALGGVTSPTFGGLSGASGDLAAVISSGYGGVTSLTLNPQTGSTVTYGGVIADGAASMTLTKTGAGTQVLQGVNTYSGASHLREGTLTLSGNGSILNSAITFNGGAITLSNTNSAGGALNRVSDSAGLTSNGGTMTYANTSGAGLVYGETAGTTDLVSGQLNVVLSGNMAGGGGNVQALTLSGLTRSGASNTSVITVAGNGGLTTNNIIRVAGITTSTAAGQIIGPWATYGTPAGGQTDYAVYTSDGTYGRVVNASIGASAEDTWGAGANVTLNGATTLTATRTINSLRYSGGAQTLELGDYSLETYGLINGGSGLTISATGSGGLATPAGGGYLYLTTGSAAITASAPINDNGDAVTLVKSGSGTSAATGTLTLNSTNSTYSGGTVINAGTVAITANSNFGATGTTITFNGNATLTDNTGTTLVDLGSRPIVLNNGAVAHVNLASRGNLAMGGGVSGTGGVSSSATTFWGKLRLDSTANTFSGPILALNTQDDNAGANSLFSLNSIADGVGYGAIMLSGGANMGIDYGTGGANGAGGGGAVAPLTLNNRQIIVANNNGVLFNNSSAQPVTINTDLGFSGTGARAIRFGFLSRAGSGTNTFNGKLADNAGGVLSVMIGGGTWILAGQNTYSGPTTVTAGNLVLAGSRCLSDTAALTIASSGTRKVQLDTGVMEKVGALVFGTASQATGTWGSATSDATYTNNTYFAGTGRLYVGIDPPLPPTVIIVK